MLSRRNAEELARAIADVKDFPGLTGPLSMIDEAAGKFARESDQVGEARRKFSDARWRYGRSYDPATGGYSDELWRKVLAAGDVLAEALLAFHWEGR